MNASARTIALRNVRGPQHHAVELPHALYCERIKRCTCRTYRRQVAGRDAQGRVQQRWAQAADPASVTLPRGKWVGGFSPVLLQTPMVASNVRAGLIEWKWEEAAVVPALEAVPALEPVLEPAPAPEPTSQVEERPRRRRSIAGGEAEVS